MRTKNSEIPSEMAFSCEYYITLLRLSEYIPILSGLRIYYRVNWKQWEKEVIYWFDCKTRALLYVSIS